MCNEQIAQISADEVPPQSVAVIIPVRNEQKDVLLHTVMSIFLNSGNELKAVVVVDDASDERISEWNIWNSADLRALLATKCSGGNVKQCLRVVRTKERLGVSGAKSFGADIFTSVHGRDHLHDSSVSTLVFVDAHVAVSPSWLLPLARTLSANTESIVYPAIDVIDPGTGGLIRSDNVVGGFDWALNFRWEDASATSRMPKVEEGVEDRSENALLVSPSAPGIMAMRTSYYKLLGGFDDTLYPWGQEAVEISLRTWMCGGSVLRQPCSRVAHRYNHVYTEAVASKGNVVTQRDVDTNVMTVAEHWFPQEYREIIHKARFTGRVPYTVEISSNVRVPKNFAHSSLANSGKCLSAQWYLNEVYPGLKADIPGTLSAFDVHLGSGYLESALQPVLKSYRGAHAHVDLSKATAADQVYLQARGRVVSEKKPIDVFISDTHGDPHEDHANKIRLSMECTDEKNLPGATTCAERVAKGGCQKDRFYMMFGCPKSCGWCGNDGKLCVDFYENKCPAYKADGRCTGEEEDQMKHDCSYSCQKCEPPGGPKGFQNAEEAAAGKAAPVEAKSVTPPKKMALVNHRKLQEDWVNGNLPKEQYTQGDACKIANQPDGKLLQIISMKGQAPGHKPAEGDATIFCGIYTMESAHESNVKATRETWAKKCDGFIAFSTVDDPSLPAVQVFHEGEESYDNMWQKSRIIWKYIHANLINDYDFFLLGGDDMFYIVENLREYLNSVEIKAMRNDESLPGLYIGRRFKPPKQEVFNSGGAGYLLDRRSLKILGENIDGPKCWPHQKGFWEDVNVGNCLRQSTNGAIMPYDTRDNLKRERFHPFTPGAHLTYKHGGPGDWYPKYHPELKYGYDCCSPESISFHYCKADIMRRLYSFAYHCNKKK
eukprot:GSChrysophyteH1.ASY1.ANO1.2715.1 assembled CDS